MPVNPDREPADTTTSTGSAVFEASLNKLFRVLGFFLLLLLEDVAGTTVVAFAFPPFFPAAAGQFSAARTVAVFFFPNFDTGVGARSLLRLRLAPGVVAPAFRAVRVGVAAVTTWPARRMEAPGVRARGVLPRVVVARAGVVRDGVRAVREWVVRPGVRAGVARVRVRARDGVRAGVRDGPLGLEVLWVRCGKPARESQSGARAEPEPDQRGRDNEGGGGGGGGETTRQQQETLWYGLGWGGGVVCCVLCGGVGAGGDGRTDRVRRMVGDEPKSMSVCIRAAFSAAWVYVTAEAPQQIIRASLFRRCCGMRGVRDTRSPPPREPPHTFFLLASSALCFSSTSSCSISSR